MVLPEFGLKSWSLQQVISNVFICLAELDDDLLKTREIQCTEIEGEHLEVLSD